MDDAVHTLPPDRGQRRHRKGRHRALLPYAAAPTLAAVAILVGTLSSEGASARPVPPPGFELPEPLLDPAPKTLPNAQPKAAEPKKAAPKPARGPSWTRSLPADTTQVVRTVRTNAWCAQVYCTRTEAWEVSGGVWRIAKGPGSDGRAVFRSQIGVRGFAAPGKRRQGDLKSPTGVFGIKVVFSTTKDAPTQMPWRRRLPTSVVSSEGGRTYNTWIEQQGAGGGDRRMMSWGFWFDYNNPRLEVGKGPKPVPGVGSGIFLHTSNVGRPFSPTLACVQIGNPAQAEWLVRWLEPDAHPKVVNNR